MRPLTLLGMVGPAVALHVSETLHEAFPDRFGVSENLARVVAAGKTRLPAPGRRGRPGGRRAARRRRLADVRRSSCASDALDALALRDPADARRRASSPKPQDIDLCMIMGAGWPFYNGGITPYLDRTGRLRAGHRPAVPAQGRGVAARVTVVLNRATWGGPEPPHVARSRVVGTSPRAATSRWIGTPGSCHRDSDGRIVIS